MFCNESNHNTEAPNMQNKFCNYKSTWEVIMNSTDFASSSIINTPPPDPTFTLMQTRDRVLCLVLDVSGSMRDVSIALENSLTKNVKMIFYRNAGLAVN